MSINDPIWSAYLSMGLQAYDAGDYSTAEQTLRENLANVEELVRHRKGVSADLLHLLANIHRDQDQFEESEKLYQRALEANSCSSSRNQSLRIIRDRTICLILQGRFDEAIACEREALSLSRSRSSVQKFEVHTSLCRLAALYHLQRNYGQARQYLESILKHRKGSGAEHSTEMRGLLSDLGIVYFHLGQYKAAEKILSRALELPSNGADTEEINRVRNDLGMALCAQSRNDDAKTICARASASRANTPKPSVADACNELADYYCGVDYFDDAGTLCALASRLREFPTVQEGPQLARDLYTYCALIRRINCCEQLRWLENRIARLQKIEST